MAKQVIEMSIEDVVAMMQVELNDNAVMEMSNRDFSYEVFALVNGLRVEGYIDSYITRQSCIKVLQEVRGMEHGNAIQWYQKVIGEIRSEEHALQVRNLGRIHCSGEGRGKVAVYMCVLKRSEEVVAKKLTPAEAEEFMFAYRKESKAAMLRPRA